MEPISHVFMAFMDIFLDALPFMILGVLLSTIVENFIPEGVIQRMTPKHPLGGVLFACVLGIMFPLCECGMIPFVRRLMRKGMPVYIAVIFILVGPILNPIVFASTWMAFRDNPAMAYSRMGLTFGVALVIGFLLTRFLKSNPLRHPIEPAAASLTHHHNHDHDHKHDHSHAHDHSHNHKHHDHGHDHHGHNHAHGGSQLMTMVSHGSSELFEMSKYLMLGALLTALIQTFVAQDSLSAIGQGAFISHVFMMGFAYMLSLCSTTDAFVAVSFAKSFSPGSLLAFLVFGPMIDVKSTLMMLSIFKARFVLTLSIVVAITVLTGSLLFMHFFLT
ncbi:Putative two-component membrane permease complex subunit SMU_747c [Paenibacillus allorhizoplanae]|uniref:Two-component membrane permease complex subunit SMU_747c n=2 Tax=Paenibacillus allorhizoplanae TaxID=2905648 RepID=A0ABN8GNA0_9BACL|nr:Putative two-component membrane permease complex subunit SMU_747c [Paenibacillus allorhizoplanae]